MTALDDPSDADLKARHRAMWAMGDYPAVAADVIPDLGSVLVEACGIQRGDTVLDVACGSGNAAIPAALRGAHVTACDLTPALLETGRLVATSLGANISWQEGDAERLPFADASFDVVLSCVGVMFAPHHQTSADELIRVCRPGGRLGLVNWTPEGFVGQMFSAMKPYSPPPPPGAQPPPAMGRREPRPRPALRPSDRRCDLPPHGHRRSVRVHPTRSATTSRPTTGQRSPPTEASPTNSSGQRT